MKLEDEHKLTPTDGTRQEPTYKTWTRLLNALHHSATLRAFEPGFALADMQQPTLQRSDTQSVVEKDVDSRVEHSSPCVPTLQTRTQDA